MASQSLTRITLSLLLALLFEFGLNCQTQEAELVNTPSELAPEPTEIVHVLLGKRKPGAVAALEKLGLCANSVQARLLFANLDGDPDLEAIVACYEGTEARAIVLDNRGRRWYRIARMSSWVAHLREPLEEFLELRYLVSYDQYDLLIRNFGGGTAIDFHELVIYRMRESSLREILQISDEELWGCPYPFDQGCLLTRQVLFTPQEHGPFKYPNSWLIVRTFEGQLPVDAEGSQPINADRDNPQWWQYLKESACSGYSWNETEFRFLPDAEVAAKHCRNEKPK